MKKMSNNILREYPIIGEFIDLSLKQKDNPLRNIVEGKGFSFVQNTIDALNIKLSSRTDLSDSYTVDNYKFDKVEDLQKNFFDRFQAINLDKTKPFYTFEGRKYGQIKSSSRNVLISFFNAIVAVYTVEQEGTNDVAYILIKKNPAGVFVARTVLVEYQYKDKETSSPQDLFVFASKGEEKGINSYRILQYDKNTELFEEPCIAYLTDDTTEEGYTFMNDTGEASIVSTYKSEFYSSINYMDSQYHILIDTYKNRAKEDLANRYLYSCTKGKCELFAGFEAPAGKTYVMFEVTMDDEYLNFKAALIDNLEDIPQFFYNYGHDVRYYSYKIADIISGDIIIYSAKLHDKFPMNVVKKFDLKNVVEMLKAFRSFKTFPDLLSSSERINNPGIDHVYHWDHLDTNAGVFGNIVSERSKYE